MTYTVTQIRAVYDGSNGDVTRDLYSRLQEKGPVGIIAANLFRAHKTSSRAKAYRRRMYKAAAYGVKQWSIDNLCAELKQHGDLLGIRWGWARDEKTIGFNDVFYCDIPTGQVSFHSDYRGSGPNYTVPWDGIKGAAATRIIHWCVAILNDEPVRKEDGISAGTERDRNAGDAGIEIRGTQEAFDL